MGHVAVARLHFLIVLNPFLDRVVALAYLKGREFRHGLLDFRAESGIVPKDLGSLDHCLEELVGDLDVHCRGICEIVSPVLPRKPIAVLRRVGRGCGKIAVLVRDHEREKELDGLLHRRISLTAQILLVAGEQVMVPLVKGKP